MKTNVIPSEQYSKTYATYAAAEKAANAAIEKLKAHTDSMKINPRFIIAAVPVSGRFSPVFINSNQAAAWFAQLGFTAAG